MVIIHFCPHDGGVMYEWHWAHYLNELQDANHIIIDCNPNKILGHRGNPSENSEVLLKTVNDAINKYGQCLVLAAQGRDDNLDPSAIDLIRQKGISCVNICVDGYFERMHVKKIGKHFDVNWVTHHSAEDIAKYGCKVLYMPMAANPSFFRPRTLKRESAIVFVGSNYGNRSDYIKAIATTGAAINVRGQGWLSSNNENNNPGPKATNLRLILTLLGFPAGRKVVRSAFLHRLGDFECDKLGDMFSNLSIGPGVSLVSMVEHYSRYSISLGVSELRNTYLIRSPLSQYHLRDFECPMIGCAHLVKRSEELEESFIAGKEMIFYDSIEECVDKAKYFLSETHEKDALLIGQAARERSMQEHTWVRRFERLWDYLGYKKK